MNRSIFSTVCAVVLTAAAVFASSFTVADNKVVSDFKLKNVDGKLVSLKDFPDAKGFIIVFTCNHCPLDRRASCRERVSSPV